MLFVKTSPFIPNFANSLYITGSCSYYLETLLVQQSSSIFLLARLSHCLYKRTGQIEYGIHRSIENV